MKISILLAEDYSLVRQAMRCVLESDDRFEVIGESERGEDAVAMTQQLKPGIILMDIGLIGMNGIEATRQIIEAMPHAKVLCVSSHHQVAYVKQMVKNGARGYITKNCSRKEMYHAIVEVHAGKKYFCDEVKDVILDDSLKLGRNNSSIRLSKREQEIGMLITQGRTSREIAAILGIAPKTVEVHRYNILKKLKLGNSAALVSYFHNNSMVE